MSSDHLTHLSRVFLPRNTPSQAINGAPINVTVQSVFILTKKNTKDRQDLKKCSLDVSSLLRKIQIESMECDSII